MPGIAGAVCRKGAGVAAPGAPPVFIDVPQFDDRQPVCPAQPQSACAAARTVRLVLRDSKDDRQDLLKWRWAKGDAVSDEEIGEPSARSKFLLCVYDSYEKRPFLIGSTALDTSRSWTRKASAWKYHDARGDYAGTTRARLKTGPKNKATLRLRIAGRRFEMPAPATATHLLHENDAVTVQLVNAATRRCWTSTFTTAHANTKDSFTAP